MNSLKAKLFARKKADADQTVSFLDGLNETLTANPTMQFTKLAFDWAKQVQTVKRLARQQEFYKIGLSAYKQNVRSQLDRATPGREKSRIVMCSQLRIRQLELHLIETRVSIGYANTQADLLLKAMELVVRSAQMRRDVSKFVKDELQKKLLVIEVADGARTRGAAEERVVRDPAQEESFTDRFIDSPVYAEPLPLDGSE